MPIFPAELIDAVIRENSTDLPTLRSSALVCRAFLPSSQACIFSSVDLSSSQDDNTHRLHETLARSPHLCTHIKTLRILWLNELEDFDFAVWYGHTCAILTLLDAVTTLALVFGEYSSAMWAILPAELRSSICELCRRSHLLKLSLYNPGRFPNWSEFGDLVASPALADIVLSEFSLAPPPLNHPRPRLTRCELDLEPPTLDTLATWLINGCCLVTLENLRYRWERDTSAQIQRLLEAAKQTLQSLCLDCFDPTQTPAHPLSLADFPYLTTITISFRIRGPSAQRLVDLLTAVLASGLAALQTLIFILTLHRFALPPPLNWAPLDDVLALARFPVLKQVAVTAQPPVQHLNAAAWEFIKGVQDGLPGLRERGVLRCAVTEIKA
ncbi:hypothetical protein C8R46DRAFT_1361145 [Mycena filopes]|nr:hypothetical protein C8R46DRAFT_1361145 [Mycena filopes]